LEKRLSITRAAIRARRNKEIAGILAKIIAGMG
jgi:hypothetical protein